MALSRDLFRRLCLARDLLHEDLAEPLTVRAVSERVAVSPFHFIRRFQALFGATPARYRTERRVERAKELLALGELSVTEVCMELGYSSLGSFSALFRARVGESPTAFRRRARTLVRVPGVLPAEIAPGCLTLLQRLPPGAFAIPEKRAAPRCAILPGVPHERNR